MTMGTVKRYNGFKGWGFIRGDDDKDYFVHQSFIESTGHKLLRPGDRVEFEPVQTYKGLQAHNVTFPRHRIVQKITLKPNPFTPQEPVTDPYKFAGRGEVIRNAIDALFNNKNIMVSGERGIGKSSVAYQLIYMAEGDRALIDKLNIDTNEFKFSFVTADHRCVPGNTLSDIVMALMASLIKNSDFKSKDSKKTTEWQIDLKLVKVTEKKEIMQIEVLELVNKFVNFIGDILEEGGSFNGICFMIDEVDCLPSDVQLAPFLKATTEALRFKAFKNVSFIIAGVTGTMTSLITQHPSSSRLFENIELRRMDENELDEIIVNALRGTGVGIRDEVKKRIIALADRFPEPVQLLGYHTFKYDQDSLLELNDLSRARDFIIRELKRQEFSELHKRAGSSNGKSETILKAMALCDDHEVSVSQLSSTCQMRETIVNRILTQLAQKGVVVEVNISVYKLRNPLFKIYLRWILNCE
ncbi:MAG: cold shock domain-containing protein [Theionarchaea archaeon]|nr:cold shock domain-containing protein [Theionarchaea archaeon]